MDKKKILMGVGVFALILGLFLLTSYLQMLYTGEAVINTHKTFGELKVISNPSLAEVYIDGELKGKSTITISNIDPGWHIVEIKKAGYSNYYTHVKIRAGSSAKIIAKMQKLWPGQFYISSEPIGVGIYMNDKYVGTTGNNPIMLENIMPGKYKFKVTKPGYKTGYKTVSLVSGQINALNFVLEEEIK